MRNKLTLSEWNLWYSYSTYYVDEFSSLDNIAKSLVKTNLCPLVYNPEDNSIYWKEGKKIRKDDVKIDKRGYEKEAAFTFPSELTGYVLEGAYQGGYLHLGEELFLKPSYTASLNYIRGFLNPCILNINDSSIVLYPQLKIYQNGAVILSFRMISPEKQITSDDFIKKFINLYQHISEDILVPSEWITLDTENLLRIQKGDSIHDLRRKRMNIFNIKKLAKIKTIDFDTEDFSFKVCPLNLGQRSDKHVMNLDLLKDMIFSSLTNAICGKPFYYPCNLEIGNYWHGFPSAYLISFEDQPDTREELIKKYGYHLGKIMARSEAISKTDFTTFLPEDLRMSDDDFSVFISESIALFAFTKYGNNKNSDFKDKNYGHVIYDNQILIEYILHSYISRIRHEDRTSRPVLSFKQILDERAKLINFERIGSKISSYGEVNHYYSYASKEFGFNEIVQRADNNLKFKADIINEFRNENTKRFGWIISILFGLFGIPSLAEKVLFPVWHFFNWWLPDDANAQIIFLNIIASMIVATFIIIIWKMTEGRKRIKKYQCSIYPQKGQKR